MKSEPIFFDLIVILFVLLWGYTGIDKLRDFEQFRWAMQNQEIPNDFANILSYIIPFLELILSGLLMWRRTMFAGLIASLVLMSIFTTYVGLIWIGSFPRVPCGCAGIFDSMGWGMHLAVNVVFVVLATIGIGLGRRE